MADSVSSLTPTARETPEPNDTVRFKGVEYHVVDHTANLRRGIRPSWIWDHGRELHRFKDGGSKKHFQCGVCGHVIPVWSTTHHAATHLNDKHHLFEKEMPSESSSSPSLVQQLRQQGNRVKALFSSVSVAKFRYLLLRWICCMHICLSVVEDDSFRDLITYICPPIASFLVKRGNTVRSWIVREFER